MRIVCEKCASAYLIDDRVITPRGVRAQCPKCQNLQLVKRAEASLPPPEPIPPELIPPEPTGADLTNAPTQPYRTSELAAMLERAGPAKVAASPRERALLRPPEPIPTGSQGNVRRGGAAAGDARATSPPPPPVRLDEESDPGSVSPRPSLPQIAPLILTPAPDDEVEAWVAVPLKSPFGAPWPAAQEDFGFLPPPRPPPVPLGNDVVRDEDDELTLPLSDSPGRSTSSSRPTVQVGRPAMSKASTAAGAPSELMPASRADVRSSVKVTVVRGRHVSGRGLYAVLALLAVTAVGGGGLYWHSRGIGKKPSASAEYAAVLAGWRSTFPEVTATENELVTQGEAKIAEDRVASYAAAEPLFEQAMVKNPASDVAMAGYVEAVALGRGQSLKDGPYQQTLALGRLAVERSERQSGALVALGNLLLVRPSLAGNRDQARALAEEALKQPGGLFASDAHLLLGRSYLPVAAGVAMPHLNRALALDENFRRGYDVRAQAHAQLGEYGFALADLERRVTLDAEHGEALRQLGALYEDVGEVSRARKLYERLREKKSQVIPGTLALASLRAQAENKPAEAASLVRGVLKGRDKPDAAMALALQVQLAAAERLAGNASAADTAAGAALQQDPEDAAAHFQLLLLALDENLPKTAIEHFAFVQGHLDDPALEATFLGRVRYADKDYSGAAEAFTRALLLDPRRVDASIWSGVTAYALGRPTDATQALARVEALDPTRVGARPPGSRFLMRSADLLRGADTALDLRARTEEDVAAMLLEGVTRMQLRQLEAADKLFAHAEEKDSQNGAARAYRALIALERGDLSAARTAAEQAVSLTPALALAHYARGRMLIAAHDEDGARAELGLAVSLAPFMVAPEVMLAQLEGRTNVSAARARLVRLLAADPGNGSIKRSLYLLDPGAAR